MQRGSFDDLTRILATSTSRRQALQRIAAMLFGGTVGGIALTGLTPAVALADDDCDNDCAHFCNAVFPHGDKREDCKEEAAHYKGLCYTCGPKSPGGSKPICCSEDANGHCTSYSSTTCCSSGQVCQNGACVSPCIPDGQTCTQDSQCCGGICQSSPSGNGICISPTTTTATTS